MNANQVVNTLINFETATTDPVARRVIRDERLALQSALQQLPRQADVIASQLQEAVRVARMWNVSGV